MRILANWALIDHYAAATARTNASIAVRPSEKGAFNSTRLTAKLGHVGFATPHGNDSTMSRFLTGVDIIRDGGSIFVAFECDHLLCRCTLAFHIYLPPVDSCDEAQTRRYTHAELREIHDFQWTSKIVGVTYDDWFCSKLRVSWTTARQILSELAPQATKLSQYDQNIFAEMVDVANSEGIGWAMATGHAPSKNS